MDWQDILGLIIAGGGARMQYDAQRDALARQQREIAAAQAQQAQLQGQRQAQVIDMAKMVTPQATGEQLERVIAAQLPRLEGVAQQASVRPDATAPVGAGGRYQTEMARRAAAELERAIAEAGMTARAGGGQRLMFEQGMDRARGASDLDTIGSAMQQAARASQNRINQAGQVNPGRMFAGGMLMAGAQPIASGLTGLTRR